MTEATTGASVETIYENKQWSYGFRRHALEVKAAISLGDYLRDRGIELQPAGVRFVGLCMFHEEKTPSFTVYSNSYYCFGCGATGDVIDLHAHLYNYSPLTALQDLAEKYEVELSVKPGRWFEWQRQKAAILDAAEEARKEVRRRRYFKYLVLTGPEFEIDDPAERREAILRAWRVFSSGMKRIGQ